jgi:hypothetical protein
MIRYEGDGRALVAVTTVRVGVRDVTLAVPLGPWDGPAPSAAGLAGRPVIGLSHAQDVDVAIAGCRRSGRVDPAVVEGTDHLGASLLSSGRDAVVLVGATGGSLGAVRALGGRPLAALPFGDPEEVTRFLADCPVNLDVPVPAIEPARELCMVVFRALGLERTHHAVDVDPRPAFADADAEPTDEALNRLSAAAAGVLAGRVAATSRRWRPAP